MSPLLAAEIADWSKIRFRFVTGDKDETVEVPWTAESAGAKRSPVRRAGTGESLFFTGARMTGGVLEYRFEVSAEV